MDLPIFHRRFMASDNRDNKEENRDHHHINVQVLVLECTEIFT